MIGRRFPRLVRRLSAHGVEGARFALVAWLVAPAVEASLRVVGLKTTLAAIERLPQRRACAKPRPLEGSQLVSWAFRAHPLLRGRCLERAVVQYALHRLYGQPARLVVGVRRTPGFEAHAWVEPITARGNNGDYAPLFEREIAA